MFRMGLLTSTAMTAVALLLSGAPGGAYAQTNMHVASRNPNTRFLCTYGQFLVSVSSNSSFDGLTYEWTHVAVPINGHGQIVRSIKVMEERRSRNSYYFSAGIYSNAPSGFPGKLIAGGKSKAGLNCGPVDISIPPTTLMPNTKYWIEETASFSGRLSFYWEADPKAKHKAYRQTFYGFCSSSGRCSSSKSPWMKQTMGPYLKLK